jgi:hypothetical protein
MRQSGAALIIFALCATAHAATIDDGAKALDAGQPDQAISIFTEILRAEPRNAQAHHGLALAHLLRTDNAKACASADQALLIAPKADRALVINAAAAHFAVKNNARAARIIKDYLAANPKALDEPALNALGTVLMAATPKEKQNRVFAECAAFYEQTNKRFEAARPGHRRFGAEWYTAKDYTVLDASYQRNQKELDRLSTSIQLAEMQVAQHQSEIARQNDLLRRGDGSARYYLRQAEQQLLTAQNALNAAQQKYDDFAANTDKPEFPDTISTVSMNATAIPEFSAVQTLAAPDPATPATPNTPAARRPRKGQPRPNPNPDPNANTAAVKPAAITPTTQPAQPAGVKKPQFHAAAFAVTPNLLVTASAGLDDQSEIKLIIADGASLNARLIRKDDATGLALLRLVERQVPCLALADAFEPGNIICVTYSNLLDAKPQAVTGKAPAPTANGWRIGVPTHAHIAGSPLIGEKGKVVGMCIPGDDGRAASAVTLAQLKAFVGKDASGARPLPAGEDVATAVAQVIVVR